jgi:hypothetical protein
LRRTETVSEAERPQATPEVRQKMADCVYPVPLGSIFDAL